MAKRIQPGFNFDESLLLANFSKQAYEIFKYDDGTIDDIELRDVYNSMYRSQKWKFAHSLRNDETSIRGFIVKKEGAEHYAVVIQGTTMSEGAMLDFTDLVNDVNWELVSYGSVTNKKIKVLGVVLEGIESILDEIYIFFKTLLGQLKEKDFAEISQMTNERQFACITAMADAGQYRLGEEFFNSCRNLIEEAVEDGQIGNNEDLVKILNFQKPTLLQLEKVDDPIDVYVTGHSLGAAMAILCAVDLRTYFASDMVIKVYTVGTPKAGNADFAKYYQERIGKGMSYRIHNLLDPVTAMPFPLPFPLDALVSNGIRVGNFYLGNTAHVGEEHQVAGLGSQGVSLDFGGTLSLFGGIPFPHSPDTYIQLIEEDRERWEAWARPIENIMGTFMKEILDNQTEELREELNRIQRKIEKLENFQKSSN